MALFKTIMNTHCCHGAGYPGTDVVFVRQTSVSMCMHTVSANRLSYKYILFQTNFNQQFPLILSFKKTGKNIHDLVKRVELRRTHEKEAEKDT
jgi:hypothetical protein